MSQNKKVKKKSIILKEVSEIAVSKGGKCLTKEYINCQTKMLFECSKGHRWKADPYKVKSKTWCRKCFIERNATNLRTEISVYQKLAKERGGKYLETDFVRSVDLSRWQCEYGHQFKRTAVQVKIGLWCKQCKSDRYLNKFKEIALSKGGKCLSKEYIDSLTELKFKCVNDHVFKAAPVKVKSGKWCNQCKLDNYLSNIKEIALSKGGKCLSKSYEHSLKKLEFECSKGHRWEASSSSIKTGTWCRKCYFENKLDYNEIKSNLDKKSKKNRIKLLTHEINSLEQKIEIMCKEGHRFMTLPKKLIKEEFFCPECNPTRKDNTIRFNIELFLKYHIDVKDKSKLEKSSILKNYYMFIKKYPGLVETYLEKMISEVGMRELREKYNLSRNEACGIFGFNHRSLKSWETGQTSVPRIRSLLINILYYNKTITNKLISEYVETPDIKNLLSKLGLSNEEFMKKFKISSTKLNSWLTKKGVPNEIENLLLCLLDHLVDKKIKISIKFNNVSKDKFFEKFYYLGIDTRSLGSIYKLEDKKYAFGIYSMVTTYKKECDEIFSHMIRKSSFNEFYESENLLENDFLFKYKIKYSMFYNWITQNYNIQRLDELYLNIIRDNPKILLKTLKLVLGEIDLKSFIKSSKLTTKKFCDMYNLNKVEIEKLCNGRKTLVYEDIYFNLIQEYPKEALDSLV